MSVSIPRAGTAGFALGLSFTDVQVGKCDNVHLSYEQVVALLFSKS